MSELVARQIVHSIVDRGLAQGAKLPSESAMLRELHVGRSTLREGLRILEIHGLISIRPGLGGGPSVAEANSKDFGRTPRCSSTCGVRPSGSSPRLAWWWSR